MTDKNLPNLTSAQQRMMFNVRGCGMRGLWVHGRGELATARALERRELVTIRKDDLGRWLLKPTKVYR